MRLILVRHFRTQSNEARRIMGWGDAPPASDWETDLREVDHCLRTRELVFDAIHASDLGRARHTALYYARSRGLEAVESHVAFNEINYGQLFGLHKDEVIRTYPQFKQDPDYIFPGGESFRQMQTRCLAELLALARAHPTQTLLLVAHAGVIRALVCHFLGLELTSNLRRKISHRYIGDFCLDGERCTRYDEFGQTSGFVRDGIIALPWMAPAS
jgi:broad specificity phosphatase PhoE